MNNKKTNEFVTDLQKEIQKKIDFNGKEMVFYSNDFTVNDISESLKVSSNSIIMFLMKEKNILINKNQVINFQTINDYLESKNIKSILKNKSEAIDNFVKKHFEHNSESGKERNFVVSVMGHIDHGKSTLLDSIMGTSEQKKEHGGITQKVSIYPIDFEEKRVTFLDTPGHNLFIKMRERSASITDLVLLVIDINEGVKVQTVEVINHIHKYDIPVVVFLNNKKKEKISDETLNSVMSSLQENSISPSEWGGETIIISGKSNEKTDATKILETIKEISEVYSWKSGFESDAVGIVLDSYVNSKEGIVNVILVKSGTMKKNDNVFTTKSFGRVKRIIDFKKGEVSEVEPGNIVQVFGLGFQSETGEIFFTVNKSDLRKRIEKIISSNEKTKKINSNLKELFEEEEKKNLNLVLLTDSQSSSEVLEKLINEISDNSTSLNIIYSEIGELNERIFDICKTTNSSIVTFNVKINSNKELEAKKEKIKIISDTIIYKIEEKIKKLVKDSKDKKMIEKISGMSEVKAIFYSSSVNGNIAGCDIISGSVSRLNKVEVFRDSKKIFTGEVQGLQRNKANVKEAKKGQECGVVLNGFNDFVLKDRIVFYSLVEEDNDD